MNISPHHQRPTRYPWPGMASGVTVVVAVVLILFIGFVLIVDPFTHDSEERDPTARVTAAQGF